ncbi:MAG: TlpA disulfide reductase family protein [Steroidobacteraceae bacterium]
MAMLAVALTFASIGPAAVASDGAGGDPLQLEQFKGKVVYVDFWASWCAPCRKSFPWMQSIQREFSNSDFVVVAVNVDRDRKLADEFLSHFAPTFALRFDPVGDAALHYDVRGMPTSFLLDRTGRIVARHKGFRDSEKDSRYREIRALLENH